MIDLEFVNAPQPITSTDDGMISFCSEVPQKQELPMWRKLDPAAKMSEDNAFVQ
jgi:hypothetical protein